MDFIPLTILSSILPPELEEFSLSSNEIVFGILTNKFKTLAKRRHNLDINLMGKLTLPQTKNLNNRMEYLLLWKLKFWKN